MNINIQSALDELEITELTKLDKEYLKKQYYKLALKWHPDKNKDEIAQIKFQKINESYEYLLKELDFADIDTDTDKHPDTDYTKMFDIFLEKDKINISDIIKKIVFECNAITITYLQQNFKEINKYKLIELYHIMYKYKDIFHISEKILELVSLTIEEKLKNDKVIILKPKIDDIINHNIYKLYIENELYLVPLWHNELYFDTINNNELIVICQPVLPKNMIIDENNNIIYELNINTSHDLLCLIKSKFVSFNIGDKWFSIPLDNLFLKEKQIYKFKKQGIAQICEKDIYNIKNKSDIIVKIILL